jgi:hypothetical protein
MMGAADEAFNWGVVNTPPALSSSPVGASPFFVDNLLDFTYNICRRLCYKKQWGARSKNVTL